MSSLLNQSVASNSRPSALAVARARSSATPQDVSQSLPMSPSHASHPPPLKPPLKLTYSPSAVTTGGPPWLHQGTSVPAIPLDGNGNTVEGSGISVYHDFVERDIHHAHHVQSLDELAPPSASSFLQSLLGNDKLNPFGAVADQTTLTVTVSSAVKLERRQINQITRKMRRLTGFSNLELHNTIDPSLLAGFVIRYGNDESHTIDLSVKGQLAELAERIETTEQRRAELEQGWSFPS